MPVLVTGIHVFGRHIKVVDGRSKSGHDDGCIMRQISSKMTFFYKRIFPILWFGFLAVFFSIGLFSASPGVQAAPVPFLIMPIAMATFGYWIMKKLIFNLVDEVLDAGDALIVRGGGQEERIALSDIKNVNYSPYMSPPQVTLSVRRHTLFGDTISFCAPVRMMPFWTSPVIRELIDRIDAARSKR
jgi:hypothetical protein